MDGMKIGGEISTLLSAETIHLKRFEFASCQTDIEFNGRRFCAMDGSIRSITAWEAPTYCRVMKNDENVSVPGQFIQDSAKVRQINFEGMELFSDTGACVFERLHKFRSTFVPCGFELMVRSVLGVCRHGG